MLQVIELHLFGCAQFRSLPMPCKLMKSTVCELLREMGQMEEVWWQSFNETFQYWTTWSLFINVATKQIALFWEKWDKWKQSGDWVGKNAAMHCNMGQLYQCTYQVNCTIGTNGSSGLTELVTSSQFSEPSLCCGALPTTLPPHWWWFPNVICHLWHIILYYLPRRHHTYDDF